MLHDHAEYESKHTVRCDDSNFTNWAAPCSKKLQRSIFTSMKYPVYILKMEFDMQDALNNSSTVKR